MPSHAPGTPRITLLLVGVMLGASGCQGDRKSAGGDPGADPAGPIDTGHALALEDCTNGEDDDHDDHVDCDDPDCMDDPACIADEDCTDGVDNDRDGLADCDDPDCAGTSFCDEDCFDGIDNDRDGLTDCEDADCIDGTSCDELCSDGRDNDLDGWRDCEDPDCWSRDLCPAPRFIVQEGEVVDRQSIWAGVMRYYTRTSGAYSPLEVWGFRNTLSFRHVGGTVWIPTAAGGHSSCEWMVERARFEDRGATFEDSIQTSRVNLGSRNLVHRRGFEVDALCRAFHSHHLPTELVRGSGAYLQARGAYLEQDTIYGWHNPTFWYSQRWHTTTNRSGFEYSLTYYHFSVSGLLQPGNEVELLVAE